VAETIDILTAPTDEGMARLSGVDQYRDGGPAKCGHKMSRY